MKNILTLYFLLITSIASNAQISFDNLCSANLEVLFCNDARARDAFEEHRDAGLNYLNLVLTEEGVKYKGQSLREIERLEDVFVKPSTISETFDVVVGLERKTPIEYFKRLICSIEQLGVHNIQSVYVYFYSGG